MDFSLNEEQRRWQNEARHFAKEVLLPNSLNRDQIEGGFQPWDWEIIKAGSKLGFRTFAVPKELGGHGADFVGVYVPARHDRDRAVRPLRGGGRYQRQRQRGSGKKSAG